MRLFLLTFLTMAAFAANSLLNRVAVDSGGMDPASFAALRVLAGAVVLVGLVWARGRTVPLWRTRRVVGAGSLAVYMIGFSAAYLTLDAGLGALILFGIVQITIFALATFRGMPPRPGQVFGSLIAFDGLVWVLWPTGDIQADPMGILFMGAAGVGWAVYTLAGRSEPDALAGTAANFCMALPWVLLVFLFLGRPAPVQPSGVMLAIISGAVTSGLGYALWYSIVGRFSPAMVAVVQLAAPVLALIGGVVLLDETATLRLALGAALVLGGIVLSAPRGAVVK
ncbi:DMT family transporter [Rhodobacteraceae bacterium F11138]|nr:DMT family transporter [Rhodobacteraceae bacterium F11138]